jgi:hypothetical protein
MMTVRLAPDPRRAKSRPFMRADGMILRKAPEANRSSFLPCPRRSRATTASGNFFQVVKKQRQEWRVCAPAGDEEAPSPSHRAGRRGRSGLRVARRAGWARAKITCSDRTKVASANSGAATENRRRPVPTNCFAMTSEPRASWWKGLGDLGRLRLARPPNEESLDDAFKSSWHFLTPMRELPGATARYPARVLVSSKPHPLGLPLAKYC